MTEEVLLGTAFVTDKGTWAAGTAYEENDIVHTDSGVYMSIVDDNTSEVSDTTKWRTWVDLDAVNAATSNANAATKEAEEAEAIRKSNEEARQANETTRQNNETTRQSNETARVSAEASRVEAESSRVTAEASRVAAEKARAEAESSRVEAEASRVTAEASRIAAEEARETKTSDAIGEMKALMEAWSVENQFCGFARQNGTASGDAETTYGSKALLHEIGKHFRLMTVKGGVIQHVCVGGRLTKATNGDEIAIDGSDGDVVLGVDMEGLQLLKATRPVDGVETNVIGIGLLPAYWQNVASKKLPKFAITPAETVNCQLDGDTRSQAHSIYNTAKAGTYNAPNGIFKASYKTSGVGFPHQYVSCVGSIQQAQNKNEDALTNRPYMGFYYEFYEALLALFFAEIGSLKHTTLDMFGTGLTSTETVSATTFHDDALSAVSGWKIMSETPVYQNVWGTDAVTVGSSKYGMVQGICGSSNYGIVECLEAQRVLDGIAKAGLVSKTGSKGNIFYFDEDGGMVLSSDGSIDVETGTGMTACKHYYEVRDVPGCEGMSDGVMTAVVNSYTMMEFEDGTLLTSNSEDLTGKVAILKRSLPIYRGFTLPYVGMFRQMDGAFFVAKVDSEGNITSEFRCAESYADIPARTSFGYEAAVDGEADIEKGLSLVHPYTGRMSSEYWIKSCDYSLSLFCHTATGGGARTYENMYCWVYDGNNAGKGKRQVHGSVVGCHLGIWNPRASVRTVNGFSHAGYGRVDYAGAFAVLLV